MTLGDLARHLNFGWPSPTEWQGEVAPRLVFFSGRLHNLADLRRTTSQRDGSVASVLESLYQRHGEAMASHLIGEFAFAIFDPREQRLVAARDAMGCQPVYYATPRSNVIIATRLDEVLGQPGVSAELDEPFIAASLDGAFAHKERTAYRSVRKIPSGSILICDRHGSRVREYWRPEDVPLKPEVSLNDALDEFRSTLREAVSCRLDDEGRIGVHVSGGLDCSSLAVLSSDELNRRGDEPPIGLTWYPPPGGAVTAEERAEYARIDSTCSRAGIHPVYTTPTVETVRTVWDRDHTVQPICNATYNESLVLAEAQRRGVTTIMSGFGGDEAASFDGTGWMPRLALTGKWAQLHSIARRSGRSTPRFIGSHLLTGLNHLALSENQLRRYNDDRNGADVPIARALARAWIPPLADRIPVSAASRTLLGETQSYLASGANTIDALPRPHMVRSTTDRVRRHHLLRWPYLTARIESWAADGAAHGIRYTYPMLDRRVVELALSLPGHVFVGAADGVMKRMFFRRAMEPVMPKNVVWETSKDDPARSDPLIGAMRGAFAEVGAELRDRDRWPERSEWVDMDRLVADLQPEALERRQRLGRLIQTLEFLGPTNRATT